jgi:formylglycine-generating enzyme required for sulfatase activity/subtilisin family serine protease
MLKITGYTAILVLVLALIGCSSGSRWQSDIASPSMNLSEDSIEMAFPIYSDSYFIPERQSSASFELSNSVNSIPVQIPGISNSKPRFQISNNQDSISVKNNQTTAFDVRLIIDSGSIPVDNPLIDQFPDDRVGIDFGIIPSGMTCPPVGIPSGIARIAGLSFHIEFQDRAFIENDRIRLHSSYFRGNIQSASTTKAILADACIVGCDNGLEILYSALIDHNLRLTGMIEPYGLYEVRIADGRNPYDVVNELNRDSRLHHAEVESLVFPSFFPNDPIYDPIQPNEKRWAFERINAIDAWDFFSDNTLNQAGDASVNGIVFAIMDTGITPHEDFALSQSDINLILQYGKNFVNPGSPPLDTDGHGTQVTGIMGAMGNNAKGMSGMAWNPIFLPVKIFATSKEYGQVGPLFNLLQGLVYVRDLAVAVPFYKFIVNMSLGGYEQTQSYWTSEAIRLADNRPNILLVAGCGNDKNNNTFAGVPFAISADNYYPSANDKVVSVGASSWLISGDKDKEVYEEDGFMWGTNWGYSVDFCAPGSLSIYTAGKDAANDYETSFGGTSASCAFVSGLAGLIWSKNPSFTKRKLVDRITRTCDPMFLPPAKNGMLGSGRINAYKALRGIKPVAVINDVYWTRTGNPIFGDTLHFSGDGNFAGPQYEPESGDKLNFRWYADGDFANPIAFGREAIYYQLPAGQHTIHLKVWNKDQEWNFWDPDESSEPAVWAEVITIADSILPDDYFTWITIPAGNFTMGCGPSDPNYNNSGTSDEKPQHTHYVPQFKIRKYEITNMEFNAFVEAGGYDNPNYWDVEGWNVKTSNGWEHPLNWLSGADKGGNPIDFPDTLANPVSGVSWWEAIAFCRWANYRLPIESQWEKAARGSLDDRTYPWGYTWNVNNCNNNTDPIEPNFTSIVGKYSPQGDSLYGLCDTAGNVWEWCWEWYRFDIYNDYMAGDYTLPPTGETKCCRGGGWFYDGPFVCRCSSRYSLALPSTSRNNEIGFRPVYGVD